MKFCAIRSPFARTAADADDIDESRHPQSCRVCGSRVHPGEKEVPYPRVCAHRGFNTIAPENTLPAFGAATALGADEIEFDVRWSADDVPVLIHDPCLERISDGVGNVRDCTLEELRKFDFGAHSGERFAGLRILTLEDFLRNFPGRPVLNIDIKTGPGFSAEALRGVAELIRRYGWSEHAYFMAAPQVMEAALEVAPWMPRCMRAGSTEEERRTIVERAARWQCGKVQFYKPVVTREMIAHAHSLGMRCNLFWSDDPEEARRFFEMGIDTLLTNDYWTIARVRDRFLHDGGGARKAAESRR